MCITDSLCCTPETNTMMKINYTQIKILKDKHTHHTLCYFLMRDKSKYKWWKTRKLPNENQTFGRTKPKEKGSFLDGVCKKECVYQHEFYFVEKKRKLILLRNPLFNPKELPRQLALQVLLHLWGTCAS